MRKKLMGLLAVLALVCLVAGAQAATTLKPTVKKAPVFNSKADNKAKQIALDFIKNYLIDPGTKIDISITDKKSGLYFLHVKLGEGSQLVETDSAITLDGKYFFPQAVMEIAKIKTQFNAARQAPTAPPVTPSNLPQADKPTVELFVMSYCPYGTQMEKGILPVVKALGEAIDFQLKFVNYTMHGAKENEENLTQYCIKQTAPAKFLTYLECFLKEADSASCLSQTNIDTAGLTACRTSAGSQYQLTGTAFSIYDADNKKYGVQGSPTLIINGREVNTSRDSASLAKAICAAFTAGREPTACAQSFDSATPAPGFGTGTTNATTPASCH